MYLYLDIKRKIKKTFSKLEIFKKKTNIKNVNDINNQQSTKNIINDIELSMEFSILKNLTN